MISFVLTSVGAASQYIPFAGKRPAHQTEGADADTDLSIHVLRTSPAASSTTTFSSGRSDASTTSTAYSSPSGSPTTSSAPFPQPPLATHDTAPDDCSAPSSSSTPASGSSTGNTPLKAEQSEKYAVIHEILRAADLYAVLDVAKKCDANTMRRAYMKRCKACHPDKYPSYPLATVAFQKVSFAYDILSTPSSRRMYDLHGTMPEDPSSSSTPGASGSSGMQGMREGDFTHPSYTARADETLSGVLLGVFCDFMEGDFQMLRTFLRAMNEVNPALNISDETIENLVSAFVRLREVLITTRKYVRILHVELIQLHEIQHSLRSLPYLDVFGRLRLTLRLARCTLALPCTLDAVMIREAEEREREAAAATASSSSGSGSGPSGSGSHSRKRARTDIASAEHDGEDDGEERDTLGRGIDSHSHSEARRARRRPRVRTTSTSGPFDDSAPPDDFASASGSGSGHAGGQGHRRGGLLHPRVNSMIMSVCGVLEYGERVL